MAVDFKDNETKKNLMRAFAGESQARNRYICTTLKHCNLICRMLY